MIVTSVPIDDQVYRLEKSLVLKLDGPQDLKSEPLLVLTMDLLMEMKTAYL